MLQIDLNDPFLLAIHILAKMRLWTSQLSSYSTIHSVNFVSQAQLYYQLQLSLQSDPIALGVPTST